MSARTKLRETLSATVLPTKLETVFDGLRDSKLTPAEFCQMAMYGDVKDSSALPAPRKGTLRVLENYPETNAIYLINVVPQLADSLMTQTNDKDRKLKTWGHIQRVVRQLPNSSIYEVHVAWLPFSSGVDQSDLIFEAEQTPKEIFLQEFRLQLNPACSGKNERDVVSAFFTKKVDDIDAKLEDWLRAGWVASKRGDANDDTGIVAAQQESWTEVLTASFNALHDKMRGACPNDIIEGRCVQIMETAMEHVGTLSSYASYMEGVERFRQDLRHTLQPESPEELQQEILEHASEETGETVFIHKGEGKEEATESAAVWMQPEEQGSMENIDALTAAFVIDERSYNALLEKERALRGRMRDQAILRVQHLILNGYLSRLNAMWQLPEMTYIKVAAIMWLLRYTQHPTFQARLLDMLMRTRNINTVTREFQNALEANLDLFLPQSDADMRNTSDDDGSVSYFVHKYLPMLRVTA